MIATAEAGHRVAILSDAVRFGGSALGALPELLRQVIDGDAWRHFEIKGKEVHHQRFEDFLTLPPMDGVGAESVDQIERLVGDDPDLLRRIRELTVEKRGAPEGNRNAVGGETNNDNIIICSDERPQLQGTSKSYTLDRLHRESPDLYQRVVEKELSANAAAVLAGFRPKTTTIRLDCPESIARTLRKHLPAERLRQLAALLSD